MNIVNVLSIKRPILRALCLFAIGAFMTSCTYDSVEPDVCFETDVLPVFTSYCSTSGCHNPIDREEGYDLTTYEGIMRGIKPKSVLSSKLLQSMGGLGEEAMPPKSSPQPSTAQVTTIKAWVRSGAANTTNCSSAACDTAQAPSYAVNIQPLLQNYCNGCHSGASASGSLNFENFNTVQQVGLNGRLAGSVKGDPGFSFMPPSSNSLRDCDIYLIEKWVAGGALEN